MSSDLANSVEICEKLDCNLIYSSSNFLHREKNDLKFWDIFRCAEDNKKLLCSARTVYDLAIVYTLFSKVILQIQKIFPVENFLPSKFLISNRSSHIRSVHKIRKALLTKCNIFQTKNDNYFYHNKQRSGSFNFRPNSRLGSNKS